VIKTADWIIDLGPEAGEAGGEIVASGTPEEIARSSPSFTGKALKPILDMGPHARREVCHEGDDEEESQLAPKFPIGLGEEVKMPWDLDGKSWHTIKHLDSAGVPVEWDAELLVWLVETIERHGGFAPTNWNHRTRIEITAGKEASWFCHFLTGFKDLLEVAIRVPQGTFEETSLCRALAVPTLDERRDLPIYGQYQRVRIRNLKGIAGGWDDIRLSLRDFKDVSKPAFRAFLKKAAQAYQKHVVRTQESPSLKEPWKSAGRDWHLSQKSMSNAQVARWKPELLLAVIGQLQKIEPALEFDWATKTAVLLKARGQGPAGKIVTNMGRGLRLELRAPKNALTPAMVEGLGEDSVIKHDNACDWLAFWVPSLARLHPAKLREVWGICFRGRRSGIELADAG
jgi:excinuclease ABC subunit A